MGVARLAACTALQHLSLAHNPRVTDASVAHMLRLQELAALNLSQVSLQGAGCTPASDLHPAYPGSECKHTHCLTPEGFPAVPHHHQRYGGPGMPACA